MDRPAPTGQHPSNLKSGDVPFSGEIASRRRNDAPLASQTNYSITDNNLFSKPSTDALLSSFNKQLTPIFKNAVTLSPVSYLPGFTQLLIYRCSVDE